MAYVTDALKAIVENTSRAAVPGVGMVDVGVRLKERWYDIALEQKKEKKPVEDDRPCAEIAADMWSRIRGHSQ